MTKFFHFLTIIIIFPVLLSAQKSEPVVLISGKVVNDRTMKPLVAKVTYYILPGGKTAGIARTNPADGSYKIILPRGKKYGYIAVAEGYYCVARFLDVTKLEKYTEIDEQNLFMAPLKKDQRIELNTVFFKDNTAELLPESYPELDRFFDFLKQNKKMIVQIQGFTDKKGDATKKQQLSANRAESVMNYLIKKGIKKKRLTFIGFGGTKPKSFDDTKNNRIEAVVISTGVKKKK